MVTSCGNFDKGDSKDMKRVVGSLILCLGIMVSSGFVFAEEPLQLYDVSTREVVALENLVPRLTASRIVLIGEHHDQPGHHRAQLEIIKSMAQTRAPVAVGLEMFRRDSQDILDRWVAGKMKEKNFREAYHDNWGFPWELYRDIFLFARDKKIPLVGLNVPRSVTRQVAQKGFSSLSDEQKGILPFVECVVDPEYMEFVKRAHGSQAHGSMNFNYFCEAQLVWDKAMAVHALEFLNTHPGFIMMILTGTGHAWKKAVPEQIRQLSSFVYTVILPELPGAIERDRVAPDDADYLILGISK